ncbi:MAG: double zinc ribbon domain-containing protein [bacterium]|nr:double zinc ribbon domain-containing protein [bacterium]
MIIELIKRAGKIANHVWLFFLDLIFPIECLGCGRDGAWLCEECFKKINLKVKPYCLACKRENGFGEFCAECQADYYLTGVWIASLYDDKLISQAIKNLKYHFVSSLADVLGNLLIIFTDNLIKQTGVLSQNLKAGVAWHDFNKARNAPLAVLNFKAGLIMPVPLSRKRLRWRGFNQAEILARIFSKKYSLEINLRDLIRVKHKKAQAKLDEAHRLENIKDCFAWQGGNLNNRNIILIDDVVTTGATLNECAKILKANGAGEVWGLVVAKG